MPLRRLIASRALSKNFGPWGKDDLEALLSLRMEGAKIHLHNLSV